MNDLLRIADLSAEEFAEILALSKRSDLGRPLEGQGVALVFEKPSARTRNSMEMAVRQLGGHPVYIQKEEVGLGSRESAEDVARTGGLAALFDQHSDLFDAIEPDLTIQGLARLYQRSKAAA